AVVAPLTPSASRHTAPAPRPPDLSPLSLLDALPILRVIMKWISLINENMDELATVLSLEHRKTFPDAQGDIQRGLEVLEFALGADRKSTRLNSSHVSITYAVLCLKTKTFVTVQ